jgi:mono/diheme cytochrome c family protein
LLLDGTERRTCNRADRRLGSAVGVARAEERKMVRLGAILLSVLALSGCASPPTPPAGSDAEILARGKRIFFEETFAGNGRTCGSCHPAANNFTIDPAFIATLPDDDPLFVAEFIPALKENFEKPALMRQFGLILENLDGFGDPENTFVMRGVPHVLAQRTSVASPQGPRTGWSGDGAPGDGSLRAFATGAVVQHFTRTLRRVPGVDFRLPTDAELDALEAFMLSLGRQQDLVLPLPLTGAVPRRGQEIFLDASLGKCNVCHTNAGAVANAGGRDLGNANFDTGVEDLPDQPADLLGERVPADDGLGAPGDGTFNTPPLVEAVDSGPFFHNNAVQTIEGAVAFYNGAAFNDSPAGRFLASQDPNGVGIKLDATQVGAVAAFLRVINALENVRESLELLEASTQKGLFERSEARELLVRATAEIGDGAAVLAGAGLHPDAVASLRAARRFAMQARDSLIGRDRLVRRAMDALETARDEIVRPS